MIRLVLTLSTMLMTPVSAANDARFEAILKRLDPSERLEQVCDYAAVKYINRDKNPYRPDRAVIESIAPAHVRGDTVRGEGGAFRSKGEWYQFSFTCQTSPDRLKVLSFDYKIGEKIPESKWDTYGLWR
ncbi:MAG: DUF930 domain-containing protein [Rhizobiales bacterium]|nr:DUF930 domain-containing protein [Hyphomicrobiales bacterium]OJY41630.1 MAG: hypothetical protein BGP08_09545 [Rhizobiales bacterium 64-17]